MKVKELIEELQDCDEDAEVRIAWQPSYPMESTVGSVACVDREKDEVVVYIAEGTHLGYLPTDAWDALHWGR